MKKYLSVLALVILIVPSVAFASWWNPASWSIFSFIFHTSSQAQTVGTNTSQVQVPMDTTVATSENSNTDQVNVVVSQSPTEKPTKKTSTYLQNPSLTTQVQTVQPIQPTGTLCNGTYWSACPSGQNLVCPTSGSAYCQAPQQLVQQATQPVVTAVNGATISGQGFRGAKSVYIVNISTQARTDLQFAVANDYTINVVSTSASVGQYNIYVVNSDGVVSLPFQTSVNAPQTSQSTQSAGTPYKAQDGNCYYPNAYDSNGRALQAQCPVDTSSQSSSSSGVSVACQQAQQNLATVQQNPYITGAQTNSAMQYELTHGAGQRFAQNYNQQLASAEQEVQFACQ